MGIIEEDYLLCVITQIVQIIMQSKIIAEDREHPKPLEATKMLENTISDLVGIDADTLLELSPRSLADFVNFLDLDRDTLHIFVNILALEASYLNSQSAGNKALSTLRLQQAQHIANTYNLELAKKPESLIWLESYGRRVGVPPSIKDEEE